MFLGWAAERPNVYSYGSKIVSDA